MSELAVWLSIPVLIVEAALTGQRAPALAALVTDPLLPDPALAGPLLNELLAANAGFQGEDAD